MQLYNIHIYIHICICGCFSSVALSRTHPVRICKYTYMHEWECLLLIKTYNGNTITTSPSAKCQLHTKEEVSKYSDNTK